MQTEEFKAFKEYLDNIHESGYLVVNDGFLID